MVKIQLQHQETASQLMRQKFKIILQNLENELEIIPKNCLFLEKEIINRHKKIKSLLSSLYIYCDQLITISFNGQKYDLPLIKRYLPSSLQKFDSLPNKVIKKGNSYTVIIG